MAPGRLDDLLGDVGREEGFADRWVLHEVEDVGRIAPQMDAADG